MNNYSFIQFMESMNLPDTIYNGRYNKEPAIIRIKEGKPSYVSFIGFLDAEGESRSSAIFDPRGIMLSNVEILLPSQELAIDSFGE